MPTSYESSPLSMVNSLVSSVEAIIAVLICSVSPCEVIVVFELVDGASNVPTQYRDLVSPLLDTQLTVMVSPSMVASWYESSDSELVCFQVPSSEGASSTAGADEVSAWEAGEPVLLSSDAPHAVSPSMRAAAAVRVSVFFTVFSMVVVCGVT